MRRTMMLVIGILGLAMVFAVPGLAQNNNAVTIRVDARNGSEFCERSDFTGGGVGGLGVVAAQQNNACESISRAVFIANDGDTINVVQNTTYNANIEDDDDGVQNNGFPIVVNKDVTIVGSGGGGGTGGLGLGTISAQQTTNRPVIDATGTGNHIFKVTNVAASLNGFKFKVDAPAAHQDFSDSLAAIVAGNGSNTTITIKNNIFDLKNGIGSVGIIAKGPVNVNNNEFIGHGKEDHAGYASLNTSGADILGFDHTANDVHNGSTFSGNTFRNLDFALQSTDGSKITVKKNTFNSIKDEAVLFADEDGGSASSNLSVTQNSFNGVGTGVYFLKNGGSGFDTPLNVEQNNFLDVQNNRGLNNSQGFAVGTGTGGSFNGSGQLNSNVDARKNFLASTNGPSSNDLNQGTSTVAEDPQATNSNGNPVKANGNGEPIDSFNGPENDIRFVPFSNQQLDTGADTDQAVTGQITSIRLKCQGTNTGVSFEIHLSGQANIFGSLSCNSIFAQNRPQDTFDIPDSRAFFPSEVVQVNIQFHSLKNYGGTNNQSRFKSGALAGGDIVRNIDYILRTNSNAAVANTANVQNGAANGDNCSGAGTGRACIAADIDGDDQSNDFEPQGEDTFSAPQGGTQFNNFDPSAAQPNKQPALRFETSAAGDGDGGGGVGGLGTDEPTVQPLSVNGVSMARTGFNYTLSVQGQGVASTSVTVFNLAGSNVVTETSTGSTLSFRPTASNGAPLANGVYLYQVTVRGQDGSVKTMGIRKMLVLR